MSTFNPPTVNEVSPVLEKDRAPWPFGPAEYRLFCHYHVRARGQTVLLMTDGSVVNVGTSPTQTVNIDPSQGDVWTEQGIGGYVYSQFGGTIKRVFLGGHQYPLSASEVTQLTAAGYGAYIS